MASDAYGIVLQTPAEPIHQAFLREQGHITPKVGVNGALINPAGQFFLVKRRDDQRWSLPCGWCDVNETPEQALAREFNEEVGWTVEVKDLVHIFTRLPGEHNALHTSYHVVYLCALATATPPALHLEPNEIIEAGWFDLNNTLSLEWHRDHEAFAHAAFKHWAQQQGASVPCAVVPPIAKGDLSNGN